MIIHDIGAAIAANPQPQPVSYEQIKKLHEEMKALLVRDEDRPYAILINQKNYEKILTEVVNLRIQEPNNKIIPMVFGMPVIVQEIYPIKVVTLKEYKKFYETYIEKPSN